MALAGLFTRRRSILDTPRLLYDRKTQLPKTVQIGQQKIPPLVRINELQDHLTLLLAFYIIQESLNDLSAQCEAYAEEYLRFATTTTDAKTSLPSIGVLMCWHAHMLNPRRYDRECESHLTGLAGKPFPVKDAAQAIRDGSLSTSPPVSSSSSPSEATASDPPASCWKAPDIAAAVIRQKKFIDNMQRIGWLEEGYGDDDYGLKDLQKSVVRYHAWLDLMHSVKGKEFLVPTDQLDIDLAWHTHQLTGKGYKADTEKLLGMFLNHDDAAGEGKIGNGLQKTSQLWMERYGREYTY